MVKTPISSSASNGEEKTNVLFCCLGKCTIMQSSVNLLAKSGALSPNVDDRRYQAIFVDPQWQKQSSITQSKQQALTRSSEPLILVVQAHITRARGLTRGNCIYERSILQPHSHSLCRPDRIIISPWQNRRHPERKWHPYQLSCAGGPPRGL